MENQETQTDWGFIGRLLTASFDDDIAQYAIEATLKATQRREQWEQTREGDEPKPVFPIGYAYQAAVRKQKRDHKRYWNRKRVSLTVFTEYSEGGSGYPESLVLEEANPETILLRHEQENEEDRIEPIKQVLQAYYGPRIQAHREAGRRNAASYWRQRYQAEVQALYED